MGDQLLALQITESVLKLHELDEQVVFRIEFRSRYALSVSLSFALIVTIAISLSAGGAAIPRGAGSMLLWIVLFFSAMSGLSHVFMREVEEGTALFLRLHGSHSLVYFGKLAFNIAMMCANGIVVAPLFIFFTGMHIAAPLILIRTFGSRRLNARYPRL